MIIGYAVPNIIEIYPLDWAVCHYILAEYYTETCLPRRRRNSWASVHHSTARF